jgi:hypothetical protein
VSLFDRVAAGLDALGRRANQALDEGKLRVDLTRVHRRMDVAARALGYLTYRQSKGETAPTTEVETLTRRIADAEAEVARLEATIAEIKRRGGEGGQAGSAPADAAPPEPAAAEPGPAAGGAPGDTPPGV